MRTVVLTITAIIDLPNSYPLPDHLPDIFFQLDIRANARHYECNGILLPEDPDEEERIAVQQFEDDNLLLDAWQEEMLAGLDERNAGG